MGKDSRDVADEKDLARFNAVNCGFGGKSKHLVLRMRRIGTEEHDDRFARVDCQQHKFSEEHNKNRATNLAGVWNAFETGLSFPGAAASPSSWATDATEPALEWAAFLALLTGFLLVRGDSWRVGEGPRKLVEELE